MASLISQEDYRDIAISYANARDQFLGAKQFLFDAVYTIVLFDNIQPSVDLLSTFWDAYNINLDTINAPTLLISSVRAINQHVLREGGYSDIDAFLVAGDGVLVPQTWADLSATAGYTISSSNIG